MRGVHIASDEQKNIKKGSSPHARGPLVYTMDQVNALRIIPACAGSTFS